MGFTLIRYIIKYLVKVFNEKEKMKTNIKVFKVCHCTLAGF